MAPVPSLDLYQRIALVRCLSRAATIGRCRSAPEGAFRLCVFDIAKAMP